MSDWYKFIDWNEVKNKAESGLFYSEIAKQYGVKDTLFRHQIRLRGFGKTKKQIVRFGKWNNKHAHLRRPALEYFINHSFEETRKEFKLTKSELKSLFTVSYRIKSLKHLRKDNRRKDRWSKKELITLLRYAGLVPRSYLAKKLNRGTFWSIKECLWRLKIHWRQWGGISKHELTKWVGHSIDMKAGIKTASGPCGGVYLFPWCNVLKILKTKKIKNEVLISAVESLAEFHRWAFEVDTDAKVLRRMKAIVKEYHLSLKEEHLAGN